MKLSTALPLAAGSVTVIPYNIIVLTYGTSYNPATGTAQVGYGGQSAYVLASQTSVVNSDLALTAVVVISIKSGSLVLATGTQSIPPSSTAAVGVTAVYPLFDGQSVAVEISVSAAVGVTVNGDGTSFGFK